MGIEATTDDALLDRIRAGDRDAYRELYDRYSQQSTALAHVAYPEEAVDVVQDVWLGIWKHPPVCSVGFAGWLRVAIKNAARNRRRRRRKVTTLDGSIDSSATSPTREVARQEAVAILREARRDGKLTTKEFEALVEHIYDDTSSTQIATSRGLSRTGWWDRVRRAKAKLRSLTCG